MTELQMGLIGLGAVAVAGVLGYNKWQEVRQRRAAEQAMKASHPDVLLDMPGETVAPAATGEAAKGFPGGDALTAGSAPVGDRVEPVLVETPRPATSAGDAAPGAVAGAETVEVRAPGVSDGAQSPSATPVRPAGGRPVADTTLLSPQTDFIAIVDTVEPAPASRLAEALRDVQARLEKPVRFIGYDEESGEWEIVSDDGSRAYRHLCIGLQLANRQGPITENDLSVLCGAVQDLADRLFGLAEFPRRQAAIEAAARLDEFCAGVDIQIGINVVSQGQAFAGTKLRALAESAGMVFDAGRRFVRRDDEGNVLYVLLNHDPSGFSAETIRTASVPGMTFLLDVPCVAQGERVFNQMVEVARRFADVLHGAMVDDNRRPLPEKALEPIRKQIVRYQALLAERDVPPGSPLARRLFS